MTDERAKNKQDQLRAQLRQLILMRETGPKRAAWHAARARLIWRLHDELKQATEDHVPTSSKDEASDYQT
jgi:hypothetical protein